MTTTRQAGRGAPVGRLTRGLVLALGVCVALAWQPHPALASYTPPTLVSATGALEADDG
jgi:hypothetical protein